MPFTIEQFLGIFKSYNNSIYPFQYALFISAVFILFLVIRKRSYRSPVITWILIFYWLWMGVVYQILFFSSINPAAYVFGVIFILQAMVFVKAGIIDKKLEFEFVKGINQFTGAVIILYALIIYPLLNVYFGHVYPENPTFGLPCPTTIFTFGILLWTTKKIPGYVLIIPLIWAALGISAALQLGIKEDLGLFAAGILSAGLIFTSRIKERKVKTA